MTRTGWTVVLRVQESRLNKLSLINQRFLMKFERNNKVFLKTTLPLLDLSHRLTAVTRLLRVKAARKARLPQKALLTKTDLKI